MNKYDGMAKAKVSVKENKSVKRKKIKSGWIMRIVICASVLCACFTMKFIKSNITSTVTDCIRSAITYDFLHNYEEETKGEISLVELIKKFVSKNDKSNFDQKIKVSRSI